MACCAAACWLLQTGPLLGGAAGPALQVVPVLAGGCNARLAMAGSWGRVAGQVSGCSHTVGPCCARRELGCPLWTVWGCSQSVPLSRLLWWPLSPSAVAILAAVLPYVLPVLSLSTGVLPPGLSVQHALGLSKLPHVPLWQPWWPALPLFPLRG